MTSSRLIAAWLVIAAQAILALAVPASAVHAKGAHHHGHDESRCAAHLDHADERIACRSPAGTSVLGLPAADCDGHDHAAFDCCDGHSHLHVANVDDIGDGLRRWSLPPDAECGIAAIPSMSGLGGRFALRAERPDRISRPPPSSRQSLGSIVLRV